MIKQLLRIADIPDVRAALFGAARQMMKYNELPLAANLMAAGSRKAIDFYRMTDTAFAELRAKAIYLAVYLHNPSKVELRETVARIQSLLGLERTYVSLHGEWAQMLDPRSVPTDVTFKTRRLLSTKAFDKEFGLLSLLLSHGGQLTLAAGNRLLVCDQLTRCVRVEEFRVSLTNSQLSLDLAAPDRPGTAHPGVEDTEGVSDTSPVTTATLPE